MKKKKVLFYKYFTGPIFIIFCLIVSIEVIFNYPNLYRIVIPTVGILILCLVGLFIYLFFSGIQVSEDGILIGTGTKFSVLKYEKKGKMKNWYSFPFKDLVYVNCVRRLDAQTFNFSLIIIKKNGVRYEIELIGYQYVKLKKTLQLYFENYKKNHPEQFTNINPSDMIFDTRLLRIWF